MLVRLKRGFFFAGQLFPASPYGVEIPDEYDGKPVLAVGTDGPEGAFYLPPDAEILEAAPEKPKPKSAETTFSEMANKTSKPQSFAEVMKKTEDE